MKRKFTFLMAALLLMSGLTWAQTTISWTAADQGYENQQEISSVEFDANVTGDFYKGTNSNAPKYFTTGAAIRCYGGNYFIISSSDANLTSIVLTFASGEGTNAITTDVGEYSNGTWTGDAESVTFTIGGTTGHRRIAAFAITYGGEAPTPTVATPTFSPAEGTYTEAQSVEISCTTEGATIYYTLNGEDPTTNSTAYSEAITIEETKTVKAFAVKEGFNNSPVASATYTITAPPQAQTFSRIVDHAVVAGQTYLIVDVASGRALTSANGSTNSPEAVAVTIENNKITTDNTDLQWTFEASTDGGYIIYPLGSTTTWLYSTNTNDGVRIGTNDNKVWELNITDNGSDYHGFKNTKTTQGRYLGVYNASSWRTYTSIHDNIKATQIELFVLGDAPALPPVISANNVDLAYDDEAGSIAYTIDNPVEGGVLTAGVTSSTIEDFNLGEVGDATILFTCSPNDDATTARTAIVTLTYTYESRATVTKEVTVTQAVAPMIYTTIPALFAAATSTEQSVLVTFNGWVVTGVSTNGKYVFVTDGNGNGFVIYSSNSMADIYEVGNTLTGTVECTLKLNAGYARLTNVPSESLTIGTGGSVGFTEIEMADLAGVNTGALVQYESLTCSISGNNYFLSDGTTTLQLYNSLFAFEALQAGHTYNISGVYQQYNATKEILPRSADDIEEVVIVTPSITVTPATVDAPFTAADGTLAITYENIPDLISFDYYFCDAEGNELEDADPNYPGDWIDAEIQNENDEYSLYYVINANDGDARTAYIKVYTPEAEGVYAIVTVNQAAYVPPFEPATYILANSIVSGQTYIVVGRNGDDYAMGEQKSNNRDAVEISIDETIATVSSENVYEFVITALDEAGFYSIYDARYPGYLYAASNNSNHLKTESELDANHNGDWEITFDAETGAASIVATNSSNRNVMQYNSGSSLFSCYASASQKPVYLYVKSNEPFINVTPNLVEVDADEHDGTLALAYANLEISDMSDFGVQYYDAEGEEAEDPEWIEVLVAEQDPEIGDGYVVSYYMLENDGEERTVYFKVFALGDEEYVYSNLVTVTQAAPESLITLDTYNVEVSAEGGEGTINVTYWDLSVIPSFLSVNFFAEDGETSATYDWITVELDANSNVHYVVEANQGDARTAYFRIVYDMEVLEELRSDWNGGETSHASSDLVTVTQAAYEAPATTGTIVFGNNGTKINAASVTGDDSMGNTWTITTEGTTSFTQNAEYSQVGKSAEPATSITFTTTLPQEATITAFSAKFGGFNGTAGDVSLNVGETEVGTGSLNGTADVVVENTQTTTGTVLTVTVTNIAKGVKCYYISYSISLGTDPIITVPVSVNLASDATEGEFTYSIINPVAGVTLSATSTDEWISNIAVTADNVTFTTTANTETTERQGTITVSYEGAEDKTVTVIQAAYVAPVPTTTYTLATSIESGRHYIIVAMDGDEAYAMGGQNNNNRAAVSITVEDGVAQVSSDDVYEFVINTVGFTDEIDPYFEPRSGWSPAAYPGYWKYTIYDAAQPGYLYAASSSNNYLKTETHLDANDNGVWAIEIYDENETQYAAHIAAFGDNTRKVMRYNSSNHIFSCYGTGNNMKSICLYVKDEDLPQYDFYKDVKGYGTSEGGYALMATPTTENANPNLVGMITDDGTDPDNFTYDLYGFDFTQDQEWRNYRSNAFNMNNGQGYLYANKNNVTLHFQGASYTSYKTVNLQFGNTNNHWNGWNLIGNPRSDVSWVGTSNFYVMNEAGTELELSNRSYVNPMEGIFVKATAANQSIYFADFWYYEEEWLDEILNIKVNGNNSSGDFARIRFGEGRNLEKFMLNQNHTKLYFTQGNKDFAVVRSANEGEMPVNFKAETNGTYTISVKAENVDMSYLHLIDNVTGADVDLLATPSYSFEANTNDYATRFRLVFKANANVHENADADADTFAFFNGNEWVVSNIGEATLQVVDVMGRVLSSETINGNAEISIKQEPGVYMLRLINGDNVRTQKVVVR